MAGVDINRTTEGVDLPPQISTEIWGNAVENSVVMSVSRQIVLPGSGVTVQAITGEPVAQWTGETEKKPVSRGGVGSKLITPYKLAVIEPFSMEFRRDAASLYNELARRLPYSLAKAFDETVYGSRAVPGENFDTLSDTETTADIGPATTTRDLVAAYTAVSEAGGDISAWIGTPQLAGLLITANSTSENFDLTSNAQVTSVFGAPVYKTRADFPDGTLGYAGDFQADAVYGTVEGVQVSISDQATLEEDDGTLIYLWQQNMFAIRAEIEVGFRVTDPNRFVSLTGGSGS